MSVITRGTKASFSAAVTGRNELVPELSQQHLPVFLIVGDILKVIFHRSRKADVHDHVEIALEHLRDHLAQFRWSKCALFFARVVAALDFVHDGGIS